MGEHDNGDRVVLRHGAVVEAREPLGELVEPADLGVVVLDLARGEVREGLHLDLVDHRVEDFLALAVARADEHGDDHPLAVLRRLVAEADRDRLATRPQLIGDHGRVKVQGEGWQGFRA